MEKDNAFKEGTAIRVTLKLPHCLVSQRELVFLCVHIRIDTLLKCTPSHDSESRQAMRCYGAQGESGLKFNVLLKASIHSEIITLHRGEKSKQQSKEPGSLKVDWHLATEKRKKFGSSELGWNEKAEASRETRRGRAPTATILSVYKTKTSPWTSFLLGVPHAFTDNTQHIAANQPITAEFCLRGLIG